MVGGNWQRTSENQKSCGYDVIVGGELFTDYSDHPRKLVTLNPKLKSTGRTRTSFFRCGMPTVAKYFLKDFSEKSGRCGIAAGLRSVALYLWRIGDIRQQIWPLQQYLGFTAGRWLWSFEHKADSLIAKFSKGRNGQRDWCMTDGDYSALVIWLSACHGLLIITDNAITYKAQRDKTELKFKERGNYWHADASAWCCCARCKIHEGVSWWSAENDALRGHCRWSSSVALSKQSVSQCVSTVWRG